MSNIKRDPKRDDQVAEGAVAFTLTQPVDLARFSETLSAEMGWRKDSGLVADGNLDSASPEDPATLWVLRADVDAHAVRRALTAYQEVEAPVFDADELQALREKAASGHDLTASEVQNALRLLLTRGI